MNLHEYMASPGCYECISLPVCNSQDSCKRATYTNAKLLVVRKLAKNSKQKEINEVLRSLRRSLGLLYRTDYKKVLSYLLPLASQKVREEYLEEWYFSSLDIVERILQSGRISSRVVRKCAVKLAEAVEIHLSYRRNWREQEEYRAVAAAETIRLLLNYGYHFSLPKKLTKALLSFVTQLGWTDTAKMFLEKFAKKRTKRKRR